MWGYFCIGFIGFILAGKDLTDLPIFCHQITSKKKKKKKWWWYNSKLFYDKRLKMTECNSYETYNI